ncbi:MAG TPA: tail fiber protein [Beijerinckiaceae bacterium]|jgi:microcystin-dependent protein
MSDPFVAEIRIFPFNFAPMGWAMCNGQILPISQNTALFSLLGTTYGGDGKSTFALPNLQGAAPMQPGQGQGLSLRDLGEMSGVETITLLTSEMPVHPHLFGAAAVDATVGSPANAVVAQGNWLFQGKGGGVEIYTSKPADQAMDLKALSIAGGSQPHNNMQPYLTLNFCIAMQGVFPPRT